MENKRCIVCSAPLFPSALPGLLECQACGFVSADLDLSSEDLQRIYSHGYFHGEEYFDYLSEKEMLQKNFRRRLATLLEYVPDPRKKNIFEIGCAYGFFLDVAKDYFSDYAGIDISTEGTNFATRLLHREILTGDYLAQKAVNNYDIYCLWSTIEHLNEPHSYIEKISTEINAHGLLTITTGDIGSFVARFRGPRWRQIHPPTHLHYFSFATLKALLAKYNFEVVHCSYPGDYRNVKAMLISILAKRHGPPVVRKLVEELFPPWGLYLNLYDVMYVIAQRR